MFKDLKEKVLKPEATEDAADFPERWEGLVRASILSTTTNKIYNYLQLCDQKAMGIIILNSIIIPVAMNAKDDPGFTIAATIAIITAIISMFLAISCIFPRRRMYGKPDGSLNLLHFSDIGQLTETEYLKKINPVYNDKELLAQEVLKDIHDVSRRILIPKFALLKYSYITFFIGNVAAIGTFLAVSWQ